MSRRRTRIKVCGITSVEDATAAINGGADALGFIFAEKSPRYVSPNDAREIVSELPPFIHFVGVFVDKDPIEVQEIIEYCGLTHVQLHGKENPEYCENLANSASPCKLIKAFRVGSATMAADFTPYEKSVIGFLLDTYVEGIEGGTGKTFDWQLIETLKLQRPVILAGGLSPENVAEAVTKVAPFAIDVNSGVEIEPGKKDHAKLAELMKTVAELGGA